ncbi:MAG: serine protease [Bacteroidetes bacterium HGW-Bacteroidetes-17]|nr:MAG: serine protease [Bacteroidetes bacterium HGW-Bacteroidetes-17]
MRKLILLLFIALLGIQPIANANEGMWIPSLIARLNIAEMQKMGFNLSAEELFSIKNSSIKDAIVIFGGGCTGEIISSEGLLITNHHCGYGSIQKVSTVDNDYLTNGFWAYSKKEEIPISGLSVRFLIDMKDVTSEALKGVNANMTETERKDLIALNSNTIRKAATEGNHYDALVRSYFEGNEYYLLVYERFDDVRLVGTPPESIGKFGADTDNWMWPRHTGDFSMFRVYMSPDGKPAQFSDKNIPLKPKHFLPISLKGVKKDDFAMVMGYPGSTDRYLSSWGVEQVINQKAPMTVAIRDRVLNIMKEDMDASEKVRLQYASKFAGIANYWKFYIGQKKGLTRLKIADKKRALEADFAKWAKGKPQFEPALGLMKEGIEEMSKNYPASLYFSEAIQRGNEIIRYSNTFKLLYTELSKKEQDTKKIESIISRLKSGIEGHFKDYNAPTDLKLLANSLNHYYTDIPKEVSPKYFVEIAAKYKTDFNKMADDMFKNSFFGDEQKVAKFLDDPSLKSLEKDPVFKLMQAFYDNQEIISAKMVLPYENLAKGNRLFVAGLQQMNPNQRYSPNANSTMRVTYGSVQDYYPADAIHYNYITTLDGVMDKEDPNVREFNVPKKLKQIYEAKNYGDYAENGTVVTCFLTNLDITGGNSGSPVINGDGQLIGLAFDGNWEAMSGDIAFEEKLQRCIAVDIRYVMLIIDKMAGAQNLLDEMTIVKK